MVLKPTSSICWLSNRLWSPRLLLSFESCKVQWPSATIQWKAASQKCFEFVSINCLKINLPSKPSFPFWMSSTLDYLFSLSVNKNCFKNYLYLKKEWHLHRVQGQNEEARERRRSKKRKRRLRLKLGSKLSSKLRKHVEKRRRYSICLETYVHSMYRNNKYLKAWMPSSILPGWNAQMNCLRSLMTLYGKQKVTR